MRLVSLNVSLYDKNNLALSKFFRAIKPDILCLQEVTKKVEETALDEYISKPTIDGASGELLHSFYGPMWQTSNHLTTNYHNDPQFRVSYGGILEFGNYIKSSYPITFASNLFIENNYSYVTDWSTWPDVDYRSVQVADVDIKGKPLRIINYHGIWTRDKKGNKKTLAACKIIDELAGRAPGGVIIAGDFNLFPDTPSMKLLSRHFQSLVDTYKIQTTRPHTNELSAAKRNVVDYIFVNKKISVLDFTVPQETVSDHLPLIVDFEFA